ncbi:MAG: hypothetical protein AAGF94_01325 [Pseudomonadota bacterium]
MAQKLPSRLVYRSAASLFAVALLSGCALETTFDEDQCDKLGLSPDDPEYAACVESVRDTDIERNEELHEELTQPHDVENAHRPEEFAR